MDLQLPLIELTNEDLKIIQIPLDELPASSTFRVPKGHPTQEFVQDILEHGQREPIRVSHDYGGGYFVMAGRRRVMAIRKLQETLPEDGRWNTVLAVSSEEQSDDAMIGAMSASNNMRSDNPLSDLEAIKYFQEKYPGLGNKALAKLLGMSLQTLKKRLTLTKLDSLLMTEYEQGKIATGAAEEAAKLPVSMQSKLYVTLRQKGHLSVEDVQDAQRVRVQETGETQLELPVLGDFEEEKVETEPVGLKVDLELLKQQQMNLIKTIDDPAYLSEKQLEHLRGLEEMISSIISSLEDNGSILLIT
jgi:ParB-like chromosome segregation protein Spo0J